MKKLRQNKDIERFDADDELFSPTSDESPEPYPEEGAREREVITTSVDPDVSTILNQIGDKTLVLRPDFQRYRVWERSRQSRLIESLLLNIPVPPCYFAEDPEGTHVVVDGQQRLRAIDEFIHGKYRLSGLEVRADLNGTGWKTLPASDRRRISRQVLRTIVISRYSHPDIRFEIFRRLNTGGVPLTEQEIRNAIYRGSFNKLLNDLAELPAFLAVLRRKEPDKRMRHHELVLRYFALSDALGDFKPPLKKVLSDFMKGQMKASKATLANLAAEFERSLNSVVTVFGENAFRRYTSDADGTKGYENVISKAVYDLQMLGIGQLSPKDLKLKATVIREAFERLSIKDAEFNDLLSRATDHRTRLYSRMRRWSSALQRAGVKTQLSTRLPPKKRW